MHNLLNTLDRKHFMLITTLNCDEMPKVSVLDLAKRCGCSEKTIYTYLETIQTEWHEILTIKNHAGRYSVSSYNQKVNEVILRSYLIRSLPIALFLDIFFNPTCSNEMRMHKFYISESTFYRTIRSLNHEFSTSAIRIKRNGSKPVTLESEQEHYIRKFVTCLLLELYDIEGLDSVLPINVKGCVDYFTVLFQDRGIYYDGLTLVFSVVLFAVSEIREQQGYCSDLCLTDATRTESWNPQTLFKISKDHRQTDVTYAISEVLYYHTKVLDPKITDAFTEVFIEHLHATGRYDLSNESRQCLTVFHQTLLNNYFLYPFKTSLFIDRVAAFNSALSREFASLKLDVHDALMKAQSEIQLDPSLYIDDLLYWGTLNCSDLLTYTTRVIKSVIVSDLGLQHAQFIRSMLIARLALDPQRFVFDCFNLQDYTLQAYDLTIATERILQDTIIIDDVPSKKQLMKILKCLHQL